MLLQPGGYYPFHWTHLLHLASNHRVLLRDTQPKDTLSLALGQSWQAYRINSNMKYVDEYRWNTRFAKDQEAHAIGDYFAGI